MDDKIEVSYVKQFSDNFRLALQDGASELRANVTEKDVGNAKAKSFDDIGRTDVIDKTARHPDTPEITIDHNRRWLRCNTRHWSTLIDEDDKIQMLADPTSDYLQTAKNAFGRKIGDCGRRFRSGYDGHGYGNDGKFPDRQLYDLGIFLDGGRIDKHSHGHEQTAYSENGTYYRSDQR